MALNSNSMALNESQQKELSKIVTSDLWKSVERTVLDMTDGSVDGLPMDQASIKMSNEKGVRNAFRLIRRISQPDAPLTSPLPRKSLH